MSVIAYKGLRRNSGVGRQRVFKNMSDGSTVPLCIEPSQALTHHSPEFNWSYTGAGPAQLALAILYDVTGDPEVSLKYYQWFKEDFIALLRESWQLQVSVIKDWLSKELAKENN